MACVLAGAGCRGAPPINTMTMQDELCGLVIQQGVLLDGFKPWLVRRLGVCHNRTWDWLVLVAAFDDPVNADLGLADESGHKIATDTLLRERTVRRKEEPR